MKYGSEGRVHVALRLALAETRSHRARIRNRRLIQRCYGSSKSGLRRMTKTACLVLVHRQVFIEEQQLPQRADLSFAIERGAIHLLQRARFYAVKISDNPRHILIERWWHLSGRNSQLFGGWSWLTLGNERTSRYQQASETLHHPGIEHAFLPFPSWISFVLPWSPSF